MKRAMKPKLAQNSVLWNGSSEPPEVLHTVTAGDTGDL